GVREQAAAARVDDAVDRDVTVGDECDRAAADQRDRAGDLQALEPEHRDRAAELKVDAVLDPGLWTVVLVLAAERADAAVIAVDHDTVAERRVLEPISRDVARQDAVRRDAAAPRRDDVG